MVRKFPGGKSIRAEIPSKKSPCCPLCIICIIACCDVPYSLLIFNEVAGGVGGGGVREVWGGVTLPGNVKAMLS